MNERIKQLAEQSGLGFLYKDNWRCETEIQHFAELICQDYANQFITDAERDENIRSEERRHLAGHYSAIVRDAVLTEREACIKLLEGFSKTGMVPVKDTWRMGLIAGANAIRGRTKPKSDFKNQMDDNWSGII